MKKTYLPKLLMVLLVGSTVYTNTVLAQTTEYSNNMRKEHDFLGEVLVPSNAYYGVQTMRAIENFTITEHKLDKDFIVAMAMVKKAACLANMSTNRMPKNIGNALLQACDEIIAGKYIDQFPICYLVWLMLLYHYNHIYLVIYHYYHVY